MRFINYVVAVLAALAMSATVLVLPSAAAGGSSSSAGTEASAVTRSFAPLAKESRTVTLKLTEPRNNYFVAKGKVKPRYVNRAVILQRKTCKGCAWKFYAKDRTNANSVYVVKNLAKPRAGKKFWYRAVVWGNSKYKTAKSDVWWIRTYRA